jgi:hypothetical protein
LSSLKPRTDFDWPAPKKTVSLSLKIHYIDFDWSMLSFSHIYQTHERASRRLEHLPCSWLKELTPIPVKTGGPGFAEYAFGFLAT